MNMKDVMAKAMEALPTKQEIGAEFANAGQDAKGFMSKVAADIGAELGRLGVQGQAELSGALFNGNAYVPYGDGQKTVEAPEQQKEIERDGMEM